MIGTNLVQEERYLLQIWRFIGTVEERDQSGGEEIYYRTGNATMRVIGNGIGILAEAQQNMTRAG